MLIIFLIVSVIEPSIIKNINSIYEISKDIKWKNKYMILERYGNSCSIVIINRSYINFICDKESHDINNSDESFKLNYLIIYAFESNKWP